jgi:hypothetical protein
MATEGVLVICTSALVGLGVELSIVQPVAAIKYMTVSKQIYKRNCWGFMNCLPPLVIVGCIYP